MSTGSQEAARTSGGQGEFGPGALIGGSYRLINFIGAGAMGDVYKAKHEMMPREYALKILNENQVTENAWRRFQLEAQAIAKLNHKSIVSIHNFGIHNGSKPFYVMELLEGESLFDRLNRCEFLKVAEALPIFIELCDAFGYAHKQGIIHRDIKPQNIILLNKPELGSAIRIVDFGIAKLTQTTDPQNQNLTRMGEVFGSPFYMSPEQTMGQRVDSRSDIYSLGCTLYETLVSMPPLRGRNSTETMILHQTKIPPMLKEASDAQTFSDGIEYLVAKMLAKAPSDRYQTMEAVKHDLELLQQGKDLNTVSYYAAPSPRRSTQRIEAQVEERGNLREELSESSQYTVPPSGNRLLPVFIGLGLSLTVAIAAGIAHFILSKPVEKKVGPLQATEIIPKREMQELGKLEAAADAIAPLSDVRLSIPKDSPKSYLKKPYKYVTLDRAKGKKVFNLPPDLDFGVLTAYRVGELRQDANASGVVELDSESKILLTPSKLLSENPEFLQGFKNGDIQGVVFAGSSLDSKHIVRFASMPGLERIGFHQFKEQDSLEKVVRNFKTIQSLSFHTSFIDFKKFFRGELPPYLNSITFKDIALNSPMPDFSRFRNEKILEISIRNSTLNHSEYEKIAEIRALKSLTLDRLKELRLADLESLKKSNIESLRLVNTNIPPNFHELLGSFKHLKQLYLTHDLVSNELLTSASRAHISVVTIESSAPSD